MLLDDIELAIGAAARIAFSLKSRMNIELRAPSPYLLPPLLPRVRQPCHGEKSLLIIHLSSEHCMLHLVRVTMALLQPC